MLLSCHFSFVPFNLKQFLSFFFFFLHFETFVVVQRLSLRLHLLGEPVFLTFSLTLSPLRGLGSPKMQVLRALTSQ